MFNKNNWLVNKLKGAKDTISGIGSSVIDSINNVIKPENKYTAQYNPKYGSSVEDYRKARIEDKNSYDNLKKIFPNKDIPELIKYRNSLYDISKRNESMSKPKKTKITKKVENLIRNKTPLLESQYSIAVKNDMLKEYPVTENIRKRLSNIKVKDISKGEVLSLLNIINRNKNFNGYYRKPTFLVERTSGNFKDGINKDIMDKIRGKGSIALKNSNPDIMSHEVLHDSFYNDKIDHEKFNNAWEELKRNNKNWKIELDRIDNNLNKSSVYKNINKESLASERYAYLGDNFGSLGLKTLPLYLKNYYKNHFK